MQTNFNISLDKVPSAGLFLCCAYVLSVLVHFCVLDFVLLFCVSNFFFFNRVSIVVFVSGRCTSIHPFVAGLTIFDSMSHWFVGTPASLWVSLLVIYLLLFEWF